MFACIFGVWNLIPSITANLTRNLSQTRKTSSVTARGVPPTPYRSRCSGWGGGGAGYTPCACQVQGGTPSLVSGLVEGGYPLSGVRSMGGTRCPVPGLVGGTPCLVSGLGGSPLLVSGLLGGVLPCLVSGPLGGGCPCLVSGPMGGASLSSPRSDRGALSSPRSGGGGLSLASWYGPSNPCEQTN